MSDIEKETSGILFLDTTSGFLGTGILIRRNIQNLQLKHIEINKETLKNRLTHIQIISKEVINILSVYCPADHYGKDNFFYDLIYYLEAFEHQKLILVGDFNFVENIEDRFPKLNKNDKKIRKNFKPQNLNLIDPVYKSNTQMIYTHKDARLDRFYISDFMVGQALKTKVLPEIADHKMVIIDIDMEDLKLWGPFCWKMNNHYLVDKFYKGDIDNLIIQFKQRKSYMNIQDNREMFKTKVKNISKSFSTMRSNERKTILKLCNEIKGYDPDPIILKNIEEKEQEIKNFKSKGNLIKSKNEALNKI